MDAEMIMKDLEKAPTISSNNLSKQVIYISDKGQTTCTACRANDGKKFNIDDPNLPQLPIHPNCRCKYVPVEAPGKDVSADVEQHRITQALERTHKLQTEHSKALAAQVINARNENSKLREQSLFLLFNGRYLMSSDGKLLLDAVSGKPVTENTAVNQATVSGFIAETVERKFDYSYDRQGEKNIGGIPQGLYHIEVKEERSAITSPWSHFFKSSGWGDYSWSLHPDKDTDTRNRGAFFIHGGSGFGSAGCIDLRGNDSLFRDFFVSTKLSTIYVYVNYDKEEVETQEKKYNVYPIMPRRY